LKFIGPSLKVSIACFTSSFTHWNSSNVAAHAGCPLLNIAMSLVRIVNKTPPTNVHGDIY